MSGVPGRVAQINAICTRITVDRVFAGKILNNRGEALESFPLDDDTLADLMEIEASDLDEFILAAGELISN